MSEQISVRLKVGYDARRGLPYFCESPNGMRCEAVGFNDFYFTFCRKLSENGYSKTKFKLPARSHTGLEDVEFRSVSEVVRIHNRGTEQQCL